VEKEALITEQTENFILLKFEKTTYGIPVLDTGEVMPLSQLMPITSSPKLVTKDIDYRGRNIPVLDLSLLFRGPSSNYCEQTCVLMANVERENETLLFGLIVDMTTKISVIPSSEIKPLPSYGTEEKNDFIYGIGRTEDKIRIINAEEIATYIKNCS
jgi:purine-binding chemotaxis protein CheW